MPQQDDTVQISARIPSDLAAALERAAEASDRTLSGELRRAIKQYLATQAREPDERQAA
jgi:predicted transcriptional regulator